MPAKRKPRPSIRPERDFARTCGGCRVAGIDEAGRGPLAGPVVAAAVVWDFDQRRPVGINDSKLLDQRARERLFRSIQRTARAWGIGLCHAAEIDHLNILEATRVAAQRALDQASARLGEPPGALVTDALEIPAVLLPTLALVKGDQKSVSVAAASILAKVTRDRLMDIYHDEFPEYGWNSNRGYPTPDHYAALERHGPTTLHRFSFSGVGFFCERPRRSATCVRFERLCESTAPTRDAFLALATQIREAADRLPPPDLEHLTACVARRAAECGLEDWALGV